MDEGWTRLSVPVPGVAVLGPVGAVGAVIASNSVTGELLFEAAGSPAPGDLDAEVAAGCAIYPFEFITRSARVPSPEPNSS